MKVVLATALAAALMVVSFPSMAQTVAAIDPSAATPSIDPAVGACDYVAKNPEIADPISGQCVTATGAYIASLSGLPPAEAEQALADLVVALAPMAQAAGPTCDKFDDEIAAAIRMAATASPNPEQVSSLNEIADTVADCSYDSTAAIAEPVIPVEPGSPS